MITTRTTPYTPPSPEEAKYRLSYEHKKSVIVDENIHCYIIPNEYPYDTIGGVKVDEHYLLLRKDTKEDAHKALMIAIKEEEWNKKGYMIVWNAPKNQTVPTVWHKHIIKLK